MTKFNAQKQWWLVIIAVAVIGLAVILITERWMPDYQAIGDFLAFSLIGAGFCWAYTINKERLWWAIIPGLGVFTLLVAVLADYFIGTDPQNDWISGLVIGLGAVLIGAVLKRTDAKRVLKIVALFAFLVGIMMAPFSWTLKGVLIAVDVLVFGFYLLRKHGAAVKSS